MVDLDHLVRDFETEGAEIVKHRVTFDNQVRGTGDLYKTSQQLEDLKPQEVFEKRLEQEDYDGEQRSW
ncbi:MAG: hypothetical protein U5L96_10175 [Owenweeksia sp.]|nr:hypothetical protein [Owenweeksia sp.]